MCKECWKDVLKNEDSDEELFEKIFDWEDEGGDDGSLDYGTRDTSRNAFSGATDRNIEGFFDTEEQDQRFQHGIKCFYCEEAAEWKCINGLTRGCSYEGPSDDGVQVCGANSDFADSVHPEGHKSYALKHNSGHTFVPIEEYFTLDPDFGYHHGDHRLN